MTQVQPPIDRNVPTVTSEDRVGRIVQVLCKTRCNAALVVDEGRFAGCVMRRHLLKPPLSPETKAERLLSHVPALDPATTIEDSIAAFLQSGCDLLAIVEAGHFGGALSARDTVLRHPALEGLTLGEAADQLAPPLSHDASIIEAANSLRNLDLESLPLADERGSLAGWVSFSEIQRYMIAPVRGVRRVGEMVGEKQHPARNPVLPLAKRDGVSLQVHTTLQDVTELLCSRQMNELTVLDGSRVLGHLSVLRILALILALRRPSDGVLVQTAGMEQEDPIVAGRVVEALSASALKLGRICRIRRAPEIKVKSYKHAGSGRTRYEVKVAFWVPEQYVAEAQGWDLLSVSSQAIGKAEKEVLRSRSKVIDAHRRGRTRGREGVQ